jgi:hypothetical protein
MENNKEEKEPIFNFINLFSLKYNQDTIQYNNYTTTSTLY